MFSREPAALGATIGGGAQIVAAAWAATDAVPAADAEDRAKAHRREHGEDQRAEPVWEPDGGNRFA